MNVRRLKALRKMYTEGILRDEQIDQNVWFSIDRTEKLSKARQACGSQACSAGHTVLRWGKPSWRLRRADGATPVRLYNTRGTQLYISDEAQKLLGLSAHQAEYLFRMNERRNFISDRNAVVWRIDCILHGAIK